MLVNTSGSLQHAGSGRAWQGRCCHAPSSRPCRMESRCSSRICSRRPCSSGTSQQPPAIIRQASSKEQCQHPSRRSMLTSMAMLLASAAALPSQGAAETQDLAARLSGTALRRPGSSPFGWSSKQAYYPRWLFGEWQAQAVFEPVTYPLGPEAAAAACKALEPMTSVRPGQQYAWEMRWYSTLPDTLANNLKVQVGILPSDAIIADVAFNMQARLGALAGDPALVRSISYSPKEPDRISLQLAAQGGSRPEQQELFMQRLATQEQLQAYTMSSLFRQVSSSASEVDFEVLWQFAEQGSGRAQGRLRIAAYPQQRLFGGEDGAVAVWDAELALQRRPPPADAAGASACVTTPRGYTQCL